MYLLGIRSTIEEVRRISFQFVIPQVLRRHGTQVFNQRHQTSREDHAQRKWIGSSLPRGHTFIIRKNKEKKKSKKDSSDVSKPTRHAIRPDIPGKKNRRAIDSKGDSMLERIQQNPRVALTISRSKHAARLVHFWHLVTLGIESYKRKEKKKIRETG